jgi:hypothetical protein
MKVCTREHVVPSFSDQPIPVGALFEDDSPFLVERNCFADQHSADTPTPAKAPVRKFGAKPKSLGGIDPTVKES